MVLVRQEIGDVLRDFRLQKGRTLRQVASKASVALGYLSEVERGQKEASSEILASVADALETPISVIMREVGDRLAIIEGVSLDAVTTIIPDTLPDELVAEFDANLVSR
jgi:transcriptional regulator with XRE-family HTH domain